MKIDSDPKSKDGFTQGFHVTTAAALPFILSTGLEPRIGPRSAAMGEHQCAIYFFETLADVEHGLMNWMADEFDEDDELVILDVDLTGTRSQRAVGEFEITVSERISPDKIVQQYDEDLHCSQLARPRTAALP